MVYSTRRFVVCLSVCHFVLVFFSPFSIAITSLGEGRANLSAFLYVCSVCACLDLSVSSSSWGLGGAAVCDCGTPRTFLLPFFQQISMCTKTLIRLCALWGPGLCAPSFVAYAKNTHFCMLLFYYKLK